MNNMSIQIVRISVYHINAMCLHVSQFTSGKTSYAHPEELREPVVKPWRRLESTGSDE